MTQITNTQTDNQITEADTHQNQSGKNKTMNDVLQVLPTLKRFINPRQFSLTGDLCRGEERQFFKNLFVALAELINNSPKTYETDGQGDEAKAFLHYFIKDMDYFITEQDTEQEQHQAFGLVQIGTNKPELGYISIEELKANGAELDYYWTPKTLKEIKARYFK